MTMKMKENPELILQNVKFEPIVKSEASHDPSGKSTGKEVIVRVTNTVSRKVCGQNVRMHLV